MVGVVESGKNLATIRFSIKLLILSSFPMEVQL